MSTDTAPQPVTDAKKTAPSTTKASANKDQLTVLSLTSKKTSAKTTCLASVQRAPTVTKSTSKGCLLTNTPVLPQLQTSLLKLTLLTKFLHQLMVQVCLQEFPRTAEIAAASRINSNCVSDVTNVVSLDTSQRTVRKNPWMKTS